jgi:hypothetical protein
MCVGVTQVIKSTDPYKTAVASATNSPEVQSKLGTPIAPGWIPMGSVNSQGVGENATETADITVPLKGPKASGSVHYAAKKNAGKGEVSDFTVSVEGSGEKINLAR